MPFTSIAIIGAGLTGLSLASALRKTNPSLHVTIYETRASASSSSKPPGGLQLAPNGLRSLDALGLYSQVARQSYAFSSGNLRRNDDGAVLGTLVLGGREKFGYDALRVYRSVILRELENAAVGEGVEIRYGNKFSHVIREDEDGVQFAFADGSVASADLLIGGDGIHSRVRRFLYPDVETVFEGIVCLIAMVPTSAVRFPDEGYDLPVSIHGARGAFVLAPQGARGEEMLLFTQQATHERDRSGWEALGGDKEGLRALMRQDYESWNPVVKSALDAVQADKIFIWPYYSVPKLESWKSTSGKVVLMGDAAHAIPPSGGQGINQGFEDVESLSLLIAAVNKNKANWDQSLQWWQDYRQQRIDRVIDLTNQMNARRAPGWKGGESAVQHLNASNKEIFNVRVADDVQAWLASQK